MSRHDLADPTCAFARPNPASTNACDWLAYAGNLANAAAYCNAMAESDWPNGPHFRRTAALFWRSAFQALIRAGQVMP